MGLILLRRRDEKKYIYVCERRGEMDFVRRWFLKYKCWGEGKYSFFVVKKGRIVWNSM